MENHGLAFQGSAVLRAKIDMSHPNVIMWEAKVVDLLALHDLFAMPEARPNHVSDSAQHSSSSNGRPVADLSFLRLGAWFVRCHRGGLR